MQPPTFLNAQSCYQSVCQLLIEGVRSRELAFHRMALATNAPSGYPEARFVILRRFDAESRTIFFHTDARSPKVIQLRADPRATLVQYDPDTRTQLRIRARIELHLGDSAASEAWAECDATSRTHYATVQASTEILHENKPTDDASAFANFCWVSCRVHEIDVLVLQPHGNERGLLRWQNGVIDLERLVP